MKNAGVGDGESSSSSSSRLKWALLGAFFRSPIIMGVKVVATGMVRTPRKAALSAGTHTAAMIYAQG